MRNFRPHRKNAPRTREGILALVGTVNSAGMYVVARDPSDADKISSNMTALARVNWPMPPDHGAAIVRLILQRPDLVSICWAELTQMRERANANRLTLAIGDPSLDSSVYKERTLLEPEHHEGSSDRTEIEPRHLHC